MNAQIRWLIIYYYAFPERTIERNAVRSRGERTGKWHG